MKLKKMKPKEIIELYDEVIKKNSIPFTKTKRWRIKQKTLFSFCEEKGIEIETGDLERCFKIIYKKRKVRIGEIL